MASVKSIKSAYDVDSKALKNTLEAKITDNLKVKVTHASPAGGTTVDVLLKGKKWNLAYDLNTKNVTGDYSFQTGVGKVTVKQSIPKQQWFLFPSPKVELKGHLLPDDHSKRLSDRFVASYDFYRSQGTVEETVKLDKKHKIKISSGTRGDLSVALSTKVKSPLCKSLAVSYSLPAGAAKPATVLKYTAKPADGLKLKANAGLEKQVVDVQASYKPESADGAELWIKTSVGWAGKAPKTSVGINYSF